MLVGATRARWNVLAANAAAYLVANQACAALVHAGRGETAALPQNALLVGLALIVIFGSQPRADKSV